MIEISGRGFTNVGDVKVTIRPTPPGSYRILSVLEDKIQVQLKPMYCWLPSFLDLNTDADGKRIPLEVTAIDTGAGDIGWEYPVTIGYVVRDRAGVICDDSCEFAFDGVCDDGSNRGRVPSTFPSMAPWPWPGGSSYSPVGFPQHIGAPWRQPSASPWRQSDKEFPITGSQAMGIVTQRGGGLSLL